VVRILLVTSRFPLPPWRGNQVRTVEWLEALADHERLLLCPAPGAEREGDRLTEKGVGARWLGSTALQRALAVARSIPSGRPLQEGLYATASGRRAVAEAVADWCPDLVVIQMVRCGWARDALENSGASASVLFDAIDCMGLHFERAAASAPRLLRWFYRLEAGRCRRRERELVRSSALTTAVSERDLEALRATRSLVVPVAARELPVTPVRDRPPRVLLSGNLGYRPTVDGALWFAREVWPAVREAVPDARWTLAGARPAPAVRRLAGLDGVEVRANPSDLASHLASAAVAIAPMASGSGVPMKVLEAWAAGVPVVGHPWTAAGLAAGARNAVEIAESAEQWRAAVVGLLADPRRSSEMAKRGRDAWRRWYHPERVAASIRCAVREATGARDERGPG
jgi:glycosyltransferase involved in cell wall biosynthesis